MPKSRSTRSIGLVGAFSLAALACSGAPAATGAGPSASASSPATGASASDMASPSPVAPSTTFVFGRNDPVVTRSLTGIDESYMNPGAVIEHEGTLHMFANVFTSWPGHMVVPHLTSADGLAWTLAASEPALTSDDIPFADPGMDVSTGFIREDGAWVLIFETVDIVDPWVLGMATAPGPDGPWTVRPEPILEPGPEGSFDAGGLSWPSVISTTAGFAMYYTAVDRPRGPTVIALATSPDGVAWTKHPTPVLEAAMRWEARKVDRPRVAVTPGGIAMVYAGGRLTDRGLAWSDDGIAWRRDGERPVITKDDFPVPGQAWDAALHVRGDELLYYLEIGVAAGANASTDVYLATAEVP